MTGLRGSPVCLLPWLDAECCALRTWRVERGNIDQALDTPLKLCLPERLLLIAESRQRCLDLSWHDNQTPEGYLAGAGSGVTAMA